MTLFAAETPKIDLAAVAPFGLLLAAIALLPLLFGDWWHKNRNKAYFAVLVAAPIAIYLLFLNGGPQALWHGIEEYLQFMALVGSLYVIAGGIALAGNLPGTPRVNLAFLAGGAVLANVIGTTGASMVLIRPLLISNRERVRTRQIPIFFILIVSNCGGLLTPLGDPPLFLGFLNGIDFWWNLQLWPQWLIVNGYLLSLFYLWDRRAFHRESFHAKRLEIERIHPLRLRGWRINGPLLVGVVAAVIAKKYVPVFPACELLMVLFAILSLIFTRRSVREANQFTWEPILEVAIIFIAIFITMIPVLLLLNEHGGRIPISGSWQYFWITGVLSSGLDNAPTYMAMAKLAMVQNGVSLQDLSVRQFQTLAAISCGAVFMGANSYIGNGPNFMVKAIAEQNGYAMPSFFAYVAVASAILLPCFLLITALFFL